jgi:hypothetical protein
MICVFVIGALLAMTQMNRYAAAARLRTLALAVAQQRIDEVLTTPWQTTGARPAVLAVGTSTESNLSLDSDAFNTQASLRSAFTSLGLPVSATRVTNISTVAVRRLRAVVTVSYIYRGRTYQIGLSTLRTTDNI